MDNSHKNRFRLLIDFLVPSWVALILVLILSLNILVFSHASLVWQQIVSDANTNIQTAQGSMESYTVYINNALGNTVLGRVTLMLFWAALGSIAYMVVWTLINITRKVEEEKEEANYVDGRLQKHAGSYWQTTIADQIFLGANAIASIFFAIILLRIIYPYSSALFKSIITSGTLTDKLLTGGKAVLFLALGIYVMSLLFRTTKYAWHKVFVGIEE